MDLPIAIFAGVESLHIVFIAILGGCVLLVGLAGTGLAPASLSAAELAQGLRWPYVGSCAGAAVTGGLLFVTAAQKYLSNPLFGVKLGLLALAMTAHAFLGRALRRAQPCRARSISVASLLLWLAAVTAGRWIGLI